MKFEVCKRGKRRCYGPGGRVDPERVVYLVENKEGRIFIKFVDKKDKRKYRFKEFSQ